MSELRFGGGPSSGEQKEARIPLDDGTPHVRHLTGYRSRSGPSPAFKYQLLLAMTY